LKSRNKFRVEKWGRKAKRVENKDLSGNYMLLGIISDTHDNSENAKKAVEIFKKKKVDLVVHCGDWVAPSMVKFFDGLKIVSVLGNCDGDVLTLNKKLDEIGGELKGDFTSLEFDDKKIAVYHGKPKELLDVLIKSKDFDVVLHGHTHRKRSETVGGVLAINPGAHRLDIPKEDQTIVIYDTKEDEVEFIQV